jgi:predicted outer membrane repeat protein
MRGNLAGGNYSNNTAAQDGGAVFVNGGLSGNIAGAAFIANIAAGGHGGAVSLGALNGNVSGGSFERNNAGGSGGAMYFGGAASGKFAETTFSNNSAGGDGGALAFSRGSLVTFHNLQFENNAAGGHGGGVYFGTFAGTDYNVTFSADADKTTAFRNNTQGSGRNSFYVGGAASNTNFNAVIAGEGTAAFYDPFTVDIGQSNFTLTHNAPQATLIMSGVNDIRAEGGRRPFISPPGRRRSGPTRPRARISACASPATRTLRSPWAGATASASCAWTSGTAPCPWLT